MCALNIYTTNAGSIFLIVFEESYNAKLRNIKLHVYCGMLSNPPYLWGRDLTIGLDVYFLFNPGLVIMNSRVHVHTSRGRS